MSSPAQGIEHHAAGQGRQSLVVLGIGNVLLGDDGVGVHVVRALLGTADGPAGFDPERPPARQCGEHGGDHETEIGDLPVGTEIVDGGTGGLNLLPVVRDAATLVLVDAVDLGAEPGSVHVLFGDDLYANLVRLSVHQVGASDLLAAARLLGGIPDQVLLVGVQPARLSPDLQLSPPVRASLPLAIAAVRHWCHRLLADPQRPVTPEEIVTTMSELTGPRTGASEPTAGPHTEPAQPNATPDRPTPQRSAEPAAAPDAGWTEPAIQAERVG